MNHFLPFFPLKLVAFPGEQVNLHIFEPRYKQLIGECIKDRSHFGIPVFSDRLLEYGSEMEVMELVKTYPTGEMDITTRCLRVFKVESFEEKVEGKLYAGGDVSYLHNIDDGNVQEWDRLLELAKELVGLIKMEHRVHIEEMENSFDLAHKLGLSLEQEYDLLQMENESARVEYIINHMDRAIPIVRQMERAKDIIKMNGHFKNLDPLNF